MSVRTQPCVLGLSKFMLVVSAHVHRVLQGLSAPPPNLMQVVPPSRLPLAGRTCPPKPSTWLTMLACACTSNTGRAMLSRSHSCSWPLKLPVASLRSTRLDAPNVPHLKAQGFSTSFASLSSVPSSSYTCAHHRQVQNCRIVAHASPMQVRALDFTCRHPVFLA